MTEEQRQHKRKLRDDIYELRKKEVFSPYSDADEIAAKKRSLMQYLRDLKNQNKGDEKDGQHKGK